MRHSTGERWRFQGKQKKDATMHTIDANLGWNVWRGPLGLAKLTLYPPWPHDVGGCRITGSPGGEGRARHPPPLPALSADGSMHGDKWPGSLLNQAICTTIASIRLLLLVSLVLLFSVSGGSNACLLMDGFTSCLMASLPVEFGAVGWLLRCFVFTSSRGMFRERRWLILAAIANSWCYIYMLYLPVALC